VKCDAPLFVYSDYLFKEIFKSGKWGVTTSAPVLILPNPKESFVVYCDASKLSLGGVLM